MLRVFRRIPSLRRPAHKVPAFPALLFAAICATGVQAAPVSGDRVFEQSANAAVARVAREDGFSGAILVARGDQILLRRAAGFADRARKIRNTPDTKFRIESITKQFTAAAILLLVEDGKLALSDPIAKYYSDIPQSWRGITIAELLTHGSGIVDCGCSPRQDSHSYEDFILDAEAEALAFKPGTDYLYSNAGYALLTAAVERASGESYTRFMRRRIFAPLGMRNTGSGSIPGDVVKGYIRSKSGGHDVWKNGITTDQSTFGGFGSIYSTLDDMLVWNRALQGDKLLSAASRKKMFTDYGHNYGFGWRFASKLGRRLIWHTGAYPTAGFVSLLDSFPDDGVTVIALSNNSGLTDASATLTIGGKPTTFPANATRKLVDEIEGLYFTGTSAHLVGSHTCRRRSYCATASPKTTFPVSVSSRSSFLPPFVAIDAK